MRQVPQVLRSIVLELLKTILTGAVIWFLCLFLGIAFLLRAMEPFLSEATAFTLIRLPMGIQVP